MPADRDTPDGGAVDALGFSYRARASVRSAAERARVPATIRELFEEYFEASEEGKAGDRRLFPPGPKRALDEGENDPRTTRVVVDFIGGLT